ncbi:MAG: sigma-70 family RNA polymerase sigma factor [Alphaproteobacteria bacterium]|nr:sigma-70 family RNA polymerase sigma factor [Alphaproteobacteria bacterium]MCL2889812.1 sigma-70 family RNA polymerase sigma factor [Alphaproteobacteria bacterium]
MEQFDDIYLIKEIQGGNRGAFAALVSRHSEYFFAIAYRFTNNRETAEDILQIAFLKLWEKPYKFDCDGAAGFKTWFARCVVNLCLDDRRARRPITNIDDLEIADNRAGAFDTLEKHRTVLALGNAIKKLSASQQTAINLGIINEMKYSEVANIMKKSEGAVKVLINRAKEQLKITMERQGYGME